MKTNPETIITLAEVLRERRSAMTADETLCFSVALMVHGDNLDSLLVALRRFADALDENHIGVSDFGAIHESPYVIEFACSRPVLPTPGQ